MESLDDFHVSKFLYVLAPFHFVLFNISSVLRIPLGLHTKYYGSKHVFLTCLRFLDFEIAIAPPQKLCQFHSAIIPATATHPPS
jgi:hypothetical protein